MHFEYISETVASGIMSVQLQTTTPIVYGVLNCLNEDQVKARSTGDSNHGYDWGKTAVEMALLRNEALNIKAGGKDGKNKLVDLGFAKVTPLDDKKKTQKAPGFF
jgi:6,7-dimethyl-8-ribityllumazine synthase